MIFIPLKKAQDFNVKSPEKIKNIFLLKLHIYSLKILGVCPFGRNYNPSKVCSCIIMLTMTTLSLDSGINRFKKVIKSNLLEMCLSFVIVCSLCLLYVDILYNNLMRDKSWRNIVKVLRKFDTSVTFTYFEKNRNKLELVIFILRFILPVCLCVTDYCLLKNNSRIMYTDTFVLLATYFGMFYEFQIALFFWEVACVFQARYSYLNFHLRNIVCNKVGYERRSQHLFQIDLQHVKNQFNLITIGTEELNNIFGSIVPLLFCHSVVNYLFDFNWMQELARTNSEIIIEMVLYIVSVSVSTSLIYYYLNIEEEGGTSNKTLFRFFN